LICIKGMVAQLRQHGGEGDIVTDFSYSRPMLDRVLRQAELIDRVMCRVGVDAGTAARLDRGMALYEARSTCIGCSRERQCRIWLARAEAQGVVEPAEFCENAAFFGRCR